MHRWGDDWFEKNGNDLSEAIHYIVNSCRTYGRIGSNGKEKYGTYRDSIYFYRAWWGIAELTHPGYMHYPLPKWFYKLDLALGSAIRFLRLYKPVQWYQAHVYNYVIQQACKKYPHLVDELVSDLDGYELIKPGIFGKIDGVVIHKKYWKTLA